MAINKKSNIETFMNEERAYKCYFKRDAMVPVIKKYKIHTGAEGWLPLGKYGYVPDVMNETPRCNKNSSAKALSYLFSHRYTFVTEGNAVIWASCPFRHGKTVANILDELRANGIEPLEIIENSPYADLTILFDPYQIASAYIRPAFGKTEMSSKEVMKRLFGIGNPENKESYIKAFDYECMIYGVR